MSTDHGKEAINVETERSVHVLEAIRIRKGIKYAWEHGIPTEPMLPRYRSRITGELVVPCDLPGSEYWRELGEAERSGLGGRGGTKPTLAHKTCLAYLEKHGWLIARIDGRWLFFRLNEITVDRSVKTPGRKRRPDVRGIVTESNISSLIGCVLYIEVHVKWGVDDDATRRADLIGIEDGYVLEIHVPEVIWGLERGSQPKQMIHDCRDYLLGFHRRAPSHVEWIKVPHVLAFDPAPRTPVVESRATQREKSIYDVLRSLRNLHNRLTLSGLEEAVKGYRLSPSVNTERPIVDVLSRLSQNQLVKLADEVRVHR